MYSKNIIKQTFFLFDCLNYLQNCKTVSNSEIRVKNN